MFRTACFALFTLIGLAGCAAKTQQLILVPEPLTPTVSYQKSPLKISVVDRRPHPAVTTIYDGNSDIVKQYFYGGVSETTVVENLFLPAMNKIGFSQNPVSPTSLTIYINELNTKVAQSAVNFTADTTIKLEVVISSQDASGIKTLTKHYHANAQKKGPFLFAINEMELEHNKLLTQVGNRVVNDAELLTFIRNQ